MTPSLLHHIANRRNRGTRTCALIFALGTIGCSQSVIKEDPAEAFDLQEPAPPAQTTPPRVVEPSERTDKLVTFEPGAFPWAKPGYRVVVHLPEDATGVYLYKTHLLAFHGKGGSAQRGNDPSTAVKKASFARTPFIQGIYLPEQLLPGPPTLHMFTCLEDTHLHYPLGNMQFSCGPTRSTKSQLEIPPDSDEGEWIFCDIQRQMRAWHVDAIPSDIIDQIDPPEACKDEMDKPSHGPWEGVAVYADDVSTAPDELVVTFTTTPARFIWQQNIKSRFTAVLTQKYRPENRR